MKNYLAFLKAFLSAPHKVGAVVPSSSFLAHEMMREMNFQKGMRVLEVGVGTGALTQYLRPRLPEFESYVGLDINASLIGKLEKGFPDLKFVVGSAENLKPALRASGVSWNAATHVLSSLPWTLFRPEQQQRILAALLDFMDAGATFSTFLYCVPRWMDRGQSFRALLGKSFEKVEASPMVWRNVPPAFVLHCRGPRRH